MKRDMDLIIEILKLVEENTEESPRIVAESDKHDYAHVQYNISPDGQDAYLSSK